MNAIRTGATGRGRRHWGQLAALALASWGAAVLAQVVSVPDAHLNHVEGSVAHAPPGEREWQDITPPRLLVRGDRLWTDRGSRAEVQAGGHALRLDGQTQLTLENASDTATQASLTQGSVVATVTRVNAGDSFEVGTPNLALRAREPGDYRIDVDPKAGTTHVRVLSGTAAVYGENGEVLELRQGQRATFGERSLAKVRQPLFVAQDDFARWAGARRRGEPTVRMPVLATAPAAAAKAPVYNGRTIIIGPGSPPAQARATTAAPGPAAVLRVGAPGAETAAKAQAAPEREQLQQAAQQHQQKQEEQGRAASARAEAEATARAEAEAQAQRKAAAAQRAQEQRQAAAARAQQQERRAQEAQRIAEHRRAVLAKRTEQARRAEDERRRQAQARREQEQRQAQAKRAESERRQLQARRATEEKRLAQVKRVEAQKQAAARKLEEQKLAEARKRQLARLQEQAGREVQAAREAQARREEQARAQRLEEQARREDEARREDMARREDEARREAADRRHRALAEQSRRDQQRREQEVWLRQQPHQPVRPAPMGVPVRRVS